MLPELAGSATLPKAECVSGVYWTPAEKYGNSNHPPGTHVPVWTRERGGATRSRGRSILIHLDGEWCLKGAGSDG